MVIAYQVTGGGAGGHLVLLVSLSQHKCLAQQLNMLQHNIYPTALGYANKSWSAGIEIVHNLSCKNGSEELKTYQTRNI